MAGTTESKLEYLIRSKEDVRLAINRMLVPCPENTPFLEYGPKIKQVDVDLSDATVTSDDLMEGVIAYDAKEQRLVGTIPDLGPLNFEPSDEEYIIPYGRTDGGKVNKADITKLAEYEACLRIANSVDNLDDYSDTTATAEDIALGKTAYSNGELIIGTSESANYNAIISTTLKTGTSSYSRILENIQYLPDTYTISGDASYLFKGLTGLKRIGKLIATNITGVRYMFGSCSKLEEIPLVDTSNITDINYMCNGCSTVKSIPQFNFSKVTNAQCAFQGCSSLENIPELTLAPNCDTLNMFYGTGIKRVPKLNYTDLNSLYFTFQNCPKLEIIEDWDVGNLKSFSNTFYKCVKLTSVGHITGSSLTGFNNVFAECTALKSFGGLTAPLCEGFSAVFRWCTNFTSCADLDLPACKNFSEAFRDTGLIHAPKIIAPNCTNIYEMFDSCDNLETAQDLDMPLLTNAERVFTGCKKLVVAPNINAPLVTNVTYMFSGCTALQDVPEYNFPNLTSVSNMFNGCSSLTGTSLNNIMGMLLKLTNYTSTKTLKVVGLTSAQATTCQSLSNWAALSAAGWTTGY